MNENVAGINSLIKEKLCCVSNEVYNMMIDFRRVIIAFVSCEETLKLCSHNEI